jgi:hypothetical protein
MSKSNTHVVIDELRPVCAGALDREMSFAVVAFHPHVGGCPGSTSGSNYRASGDCPIRTYRSCHEVDGRFDGQFVTTPAELKPAADAMLGAIRGWIHVVMPVALAKRVYEFGDGDFDFEEVAE